MNKIFALATRNIKIFFRDKSTVFFSFLAVLIVFFLYILFIARSITNGLEEALINNNLPVDTKLIKLFSDSWMMAGIIGIGCVTIANGCFSHFVLETQKNQRIDLYVTPTKKVFVILSYFCSTVIITFAMNAIMFFIVYGYLLGTGMTALPFLNIIGILALILLSSLSATMIMLSISLFLKTESTHGAIVASLSVVTGFATGAYMPLTLFPKLLMEVCSFIPATGTVVLIRNAMMDTVFADMAQKYPQQIVDELYRAYVLELNIGNWTVPKYAMVLYIIVTSFIFLGIIALAMRKHKNK